jgi:hypothetical protein
MESIGSAVDSMCLMSPDPAPPRFSNLVGAPVQAPAQYSDHRDLNVFVTRSHAVIATLKRNIRNPYASSGRPAPGQNTSTTNIMVKAIGSNHQRTKLKRVPRVCSLVVSNLQIGTIGDLFNCD